eukprot:338369-Pyramimonas_sp.AAC.1
MCRNRCNSHVRRRGRSTPPVACRVWQARIAAVAGESCHARRRGRAGVRTRSSRKKTASAALCRSAWPRQ